MDRKFDYKFIYTAYHQNEDLTVEVHASSDDPFKVTEIAQEKANELNTKVQVTQTSITLDKNTGEWIKCYPNALMITLPPEQ